MRANDPKELQMNVCQSQLHQLTQASAKVAMMMMMMMMMMMVIVDGDDDDYIEIKA